MFWSKRTVLTKRLLKAKVRGEHETECEAQEDSSRIHRTSNTSGAAGGGYDTSAHHNVVNSHHSATATTAGRVSGGRRAAGTALSAGVVVSGGVVHNSTGYGRASRLHQGCCGGDASQDDEEDPGRLLRCKELLKTLKENQLEMLLTAVESYGADLGSCVLVPRQQRPTEDHHHPYDQQHEQQQQYHRPRRSHHSRHFHHNHRHRHYRRHRSRPHRSSSVEDEQESCSASEDAASPMRSADRCRGVGGGGGVVVVPVRGGGGGGSESGAPCDPHLLCCQIWRWPDLEHSSELKRLPICHSAKDPVYICCNPYHWSRLCTPGE